MTTLQQQARALGDPTRHAIYRYLAEADGPVTIAKLTAYFQVNHNAIRQHLAKLVDAGLVLETLADASGPGRRRLLYGLDPRADSRWGPTGPYERLSLLLSEIIRTGESPLEVGRQAGRQARPVAATASDGVADIAGAMAAQGFDPVVRQSRNRPEIVLRHCPFESTALVDPDTVCWLHLGMAEGLAEGTDVVVDELIADDPRQANCRLRLRRSR